MRRGMHSRIRSTLMTTMLASMVVIPIRVIQTPRTNVKAADFQRLRWLEGDWVGKGGGYSAFYERYTFVNDSTIEQQSFSDAGMKSVTDRSVIALRGGRVTNTGANSLYNAVMLDATGVTFAPAKPGSNTFTFKRATKGAWLAILKAPNGKRTIYEMKPKR